MQEKKPGNYHTLYVLSFFKLFSFSRQATMVVQITASLVQKR